MNNTIMGFDDNKSKFAAEIADDDGSLGASTSESYTLEGDTSRDEEGEIRKQFQKETARVKIWRGFVFLALLATAVSVTATTYVLLVKQEDKNFRNVVSQNHRRMSI